MPINLPPEKIKQLQASLKRYMAEELDQEMGDLKAGLMLEFILKEIAPSIYNQAIADAQTYFQERVTDLDAVCYADEFGYWKPQPGSRR